MIRYLFLIVGMVAAMLFLFSKISSAQVPVFTVYSGFDTLQADEKDTIQMSIEYYDSTTVVGSRLIKVNGVYKQFYYRLPKFPEKKWMVGYCIRRRGNGEALMIINPENGMYYCFDCGAYLDELKQPLKKEYRVTLSTGYNASLMVPD